MRKRQPDTDIQPDPTILEGTIWKPKGILDTKTDSLKILQPTDCGKCYTLEFDSDSTANGFCTVNLLYAILSHDGTAGIVTTTEAFDIREDPRMFEDILQTVKSYLHEQNELQFICEDGKFLLFEKVEL